MKILICHNQYLSRGGEDSVVRSESDLLRRHGHEVLLYQRSNHELFGLKKIDVPSLWWSHKTYKDLRGMINRQRPDLVHMHNPFFMMTPAAYQASNDENVPVIQTLHNYRFLCQKGILYRKGKICEECLPSKYYPALKHRCFHDSFVRSLLGTIILKNYHKHKFLDTSVRMFISPSEFCKNLYCQYSEIDPDKIFVKPHFIEDPGLSQEEGTYALFVGALTDHKGIHVLLDAWKGVEQFPLKIVGKAKRGVKRVQRENIEFLGERPFDETIEMIKGAAFVIVPSGCYETFLRVIIEAYACGRPVIGSDIGALKERVIHGITGFLFEPGNSKELSQAVKKIIANPDRRKSMGRNARRIYEEKYTPAINYGRLIELYESLI